MCRHPFSLFAALYFAVALLPTISTAQDDTSRRSQLTTDFDKSVLPFVKEYCLDCHGDQTQEAKLDLSRFGSVSDVVAGHQIWKTVLERVKAGEMPPKDSEQPTEERRAVFVNWINAMRRSEAERCDGDPGVVLVRRLSNAEYNHTIRDLTRHDIRPTATFPVDPANEAGFDNSGESLTMSPALLRKYLEAARFVSNHVVLHPDGISFAPHPVLTNTDRDKYCVKQIVQFYKSQPTDLAEYFLAAWKVSRQSSDPTTVARAAGVSAKYLATIIDLLTSHNAVGPIATLQQAWLELPEDPSEEANARKACESMRDFVMTLRSKLVPAVGSLQVEGLHKGSQTMVLWRNRQYAANRRRLNRAVLEIAEESETNGSENDLQVPADEDQRGRHIAAFERFCSVFPDVFYVSERGRDYVDASKKQEGERGRLLSAGFHSMMGYFRDDGPLYDLILDESGQKEINRLWRQLNSVVSAPQRQYTSFLWFERTDSQYMRDPQFDFARPENKKSLTQPMIERLSTVYIEKARDSGGSDQAVEAIDHFFREINDQIRRVEAAQEQSEAKHVAAVLEFAGRAYRRGLSDSERDDLTSFYDALRQGDGVSHEDAIRDVIVSILMSPRFCFRLDLYSDDDSQRPLNDFDLASRLSYFLWATTPDDRLLRLAESGELRRPEVLLAQTDRMLDDDRVRGLATEFVGNWLGFRNFEGHNSVDRERFPQFTDELRAAMFEEPLRFFADVVKNDQTVFQLIDGNHAFVNRVLADHYGMPFPDETDQDWIRIDNTDRYARGGVLSMAVFLTMNAPGLRTSPVKRGYWVVRQLLGERIPPPPPGVPDLPEDESSLGDLTLREALARHRENVACAGCHDRFDSIGVAFEAFGPIGERRKNDLGGRPVTTVAEFPDGRQRDGLEGVRSYLKQHRREDFIDNLCRKFLSYALGRTLILPDDLLIERMKQELKKDDYRFRSLVHTIVTSSQFLQKRGRIQSSEPSNK